MLRGLGFEGLCRKARCSAIDMVNGDLTRVRDWVSIG